MADGARGAPSARKNYENRMLGRAVLIVDVCGFSVLFCRVTPFTEELECEDLYVAS
jgi:hypothetical protein